MNMNKVGKCKWRK